MQNQNSQNESYSTAGPSEEYWIENRKDENDGFNCVHSLSEGSVPAAVQYNVHLTSSQTTHSSNVHLNSTEDMDSMVNSKKPEGDIVAENALSEERTFELDHTKSPVELAGCSHLSSEDSVEKYVSQQFVQSGSNSQQISLDLNSDQSNSAVYVPSQQSKQSKSLHLRRNSQPSSHNLKRKQSTESEASHNLDLFDQNSSNSSCDFIATGDSNEGSTKETSWSNCYSPYSKRTPSVVSSEKGMDSLINKLFTKEQKLRFYALKKKKDKKEQSKKKREIDSDSIDAAYECFMGIGSSVPKSAPFVINEDAEHANHALSEIKTSKTSDMSSSTIAATTLPINAHLVSFTADSIAGESSSFLSTSPINTLSVSINADSNDQDLPSVESDLTGEKISSEDVLTSAADNVSGEENLIADDVKDIEVINTEDKLCDIEMDESINITTEGFSHDEISDSLEKVFKSDSTSDENSETVSVLKQGHGEEGSTFDFTSGKTVFPTEVYTQTAAKDCSEAEIDALDISAKSTNVDKDFCFASKEKILVNPSLETENSEGTLQLIQEIPTDSGSVTLEKESYLIDEKVSCAPLEDNVETVLIISSTETEDIDNLYKDVTVYHIPLSSIEGYENNLDVKNIVFSSENHIPFSYLEGQENSIYLEGTSLNVCIDNTETSDNTMEVDMKIRKDDLKENANSSHFDKENVMFISNCPEQQTGAISFDENGEQSTSTNLIIHQAQFLQKEERCADMLINTSDENKEVILNNEVLDTSAVNLNHEVQNVEDPGLIDLQNDLLFKKCLYTEGGFFNPGDSVNCPKTPTKAKKSFPYKSPLKSVEKLATAIDSDVIDISGSEYSEQIHNKENIDVSDVDKQKLLQDSIVTNSEIIFSVSESDNQTVGSCNNEKIFETDVEMKSVAKSKKSFSNRTLDRKRTARKSFPKNCDSFSDNTIGTNSSDSCDRPVTLDSSSSECESRPSKRKKMISQLNDAEKVDHLQTPVDGSAEVVESPESPKARAAKKTFMKPVTVAKKSVLEKNAYKTVIQSYFGVRSAVKTFNKSNKKSGAADVIDDSVTAVSLGNKSDNDSSVEEVSADETRTDSGSWSPLQDLIFKSACCCATKEVLCLCNGDFLQLTCEAEDTVDGNTVPCTKSVSQQYLLTPSTEIQNRAFCDIHLWRLRHHHCCPKCGLFCTQGTFFHCTYTNSMKGKKESHFFHPRCYLILDSGLPPGCPHCCMFSDFKKIQLLCVESSDEENTSQTATVPVDGQNLTSELKDYSILNVTKEEDSNPVKNNSALLLQKEELKSMIMEISKDKSFCLRPTGKNLFNPIKTGDVKKVLQLIVNGVNPNHKFKTHKNNTPLHVAAFYGFTGIIHILLQYGAYIDAENDDLETPLILAVQKFQLAVVRYLIHAGAQIDVKNENGLTAFHVASKNNAKEIAELLYNAGNLDINIQDEGGWTPLVWACEHGCVDFVKWLIGLGADPNVRDNEENVALHWAACSGDSEIIEILLENGCNLNFVNQRGDSALHIAARKDNYLCVRLLLTRGASLDCKNREGETPVMCCDPGTKSLRFLKKHSSVSMRVRNIALQQHVIFRDISRGTELYPIQAVNEVDHEEFIMDFRYITRNCYAPKVTVIATVDSMEVCFCKDNCNSGNCKCTRISRVWYDTDGCLLSDFDLSEPPAIYECNKTCYCPKTCINRVVQKGLRVPLQLFRTDNRGWGVRTLKALPKASFVCEYVGEVVTEVQIAERNNDDYLFDLESMSGDYCLDGRFFGNIARFLNHSCEPNLVSVRVFVEHQDPNFPRIGFFTLRPIEAFEELCFDYGTDFWIAKSQNILCTCASSLCKFSKDTIDETIIAYINDRRAEMLAIT